MSVSSIYSGVSASDTLSQLYAPTSAASTTTTAPPAATDSDGDASGSSASASVSSKAKLLQQLQQLAQSNPTEFKKVTADIATQLQAQAQQDGGQQGQFLSGLASKFQQASQTGSVSALEPKRHHHHSGGSSAASTASAKASAAYQHSGSQDAGSQVSAIISQVLAQDTSGASASAAK